MNEARENDSAPENEPERASLEELRDAIVPRLAEARDRYKKAPRDDHKAGEWRRLEAAADQLVLVIDYFATIADQLDPDGTDGITDLILPLSALGEELGALRSGAVGPLLTRPRNKRGHQSLPPDELEKRATVAAMVKIARRFFPGDEAPRLVARMLEHAGRPLPATKVRERKGQARQAGEMTPAWQVASRWQEEIETFANANPRHPATYRYRGLIGWGERITTEGDMRRYIREMLQLVP